MAFSIIYIDLYHVASLSLTLIFHFKSIYRCSYFLVVSDFLGNIKIEKDPFPIWLIFYIFIFYPWYYIQKLWLFIYCDHFLLHIFLVTHEKEIDFFTIFLYVSIIIIKIKFKGYWLVFWGMYMRFVCSLCIFFHTQKKAKEPSFIIVFSYQTIFSSFLVVVKYCALTGNLGKHPCAKISSTFVFQL